MSNSVVSTNTVEAANKANEEFQAKMKERMRAAMGDLMPDAVLADIVKRGVEEAFFQKRVEKSYYGQETTKPPWLVEFLETELKQQVQVSVTNYIRDNPEVVQKVISEVLGKNMVSAMTNALAFVFEPAFRDLDRKMGDVLSKLASSGAYGS